MGSKFDRLTQRQKWFILEFLVDSNGAAAARRAGYSEKSARQVASENLSKPNIQHAIAKAAEERRRRTQVTGDRVLQELSEIAFADVGALLTVTDDGELVVDPEKLAQSGTRSISEIKNTRELAILKASEQITNS